MSDEGNVIDLVCDNNLNVLHMETIQGSATDGMDVLMDKYDEIQA